VRWARSFSLLAERNRYLLCRSWTRGQQPDKPAGNAVRKLLCRCMNTGLIETKGLKHWSPRSNALTH